MLTELKIKNMKTEKVKANHKIIKKRCLNLRPEKENIEKRLDN